MIQVSMPQQQSSMGRRLIGMAAPIVGGAVGGPAGAALGGTIGSQLSGGSPSDAAAAGIQAGAGSAFSRRKDALSQDPKASIQEGLNILPDAGLDPETRQHFTGVLLNAKRLGGM